MPPELNQRPPIVSTLATLTGGAIVFGSLLLTLAFPRLHLGIALTIGAVFGAPFIILGMRLHSQSIADDKTPKHFWPKGNEAKKVVWGLVAIVTFFACLLGPIAVVFLIGYFLPSGDNWPIVAIRLLFVVFAVLGVYWWLKFAISTIPNWFRGKLSGEALDEFTRKEPADEPTTGKAAAIKHWQVAVVALVAFCVAFGAIDFDSPLLKIDAGPKRTRGLVRLIQWCRGNPNTVTSSSLLVGVASLAWYANQIRRAVAKPKSNLPDTRQATNEDTASRD